ncbi:hypothetical protein M8J75_012464 [Diaphorina citri]|nr:hypothetical protein M8J75_012464 [Diaphorina citri]
MGAPKKNRALPFQHSISIKKSEVLPDAIATECGGCSDKQKEGAKKIFKFLIEKKPEEWKALESKYDPSGSYKAKYDAQLKAL